MGVLARSIIMKFLKIKPKKTVPELISDGAILS
jgi:hypothetical protein